MIPFTFTHLLVAESPEIRVQTPVKRTHRGSITFTQGKEKGQVYPVQQSGVCPRQGTRCVPMDQQPTTRTLACRSIGPKSATDGSVLTGTRRSSLRIHTYSATPVRDLTMSIQSTTRSSTRRVEKRFHGGVFASSNSTARQPTPSRRTGPNSLSKAGSAPVAGLIQP